MSRNSIAPRLAIVLAGTFLACQERLADGDQFRSVCTWVNAARVYDEQGNAVKMVNGPNGGNSRICLCLTPDEVLSHEWDDWFNDHAYETCLEDAARMGYPDANDCAYWYEQGQWIDMIRVAYEEEDIPCDPDDGSEALGCSVR